MSGAPFLFLLTHLTQYERVKKGFKLLVRVQIV
jgi:hypothetical protein